MVVRMLMTGYKMTMMADEMMMTMTTMTRMRTMRTMRTVLPVMMMTVDMKFGQLQQWQ